MPMMLLLLMGSKFSFLSLKLPWLRTLPLGDLPKSVGFYIPAGVFMQMLSYSPSKDSLCSNGIKVRSKVLPIFILAYWWLDFPLEKYDLGFVTFSIWHCGIGKVSMSLKTSLILPRRSRSVERLLTHSEFLEPVMI